MKTFKDGPTFEHFGKSVERVGKTMKYLMKQCSKVEPSFEGLSQFLLKITIETLLKTLEFFKNLISFLCLFMSGMIS